MLFRACALAQIGDTGQNSRHGNGSVRRHCSGAAVTATAATNRVWNTATNGEGVYVFPSLPIGQYTIQVKMQGFKGALHSGITLSVQQPAVVNVRLEVGAVSERVQVTGAAPLLETQQALPSHSCRVLWSTTREVISWPPCASYSDTGKLAGSEPSGIQFAI